MNCFSSQKFKTRSRSKTSKYLQRFNAWVTEEVNRGTGWMTGLEECPDKLQTFQPYPLCDNGLWSVPAKAAEHGNHWCMRSNQATADGAGQQVRTTLPILF